MRKGEEALERGLRIGDGNADSKGGDPRRAGGKRVMNRAMRRLAERAVGMNEVIRMAVRELNGCAEEQQGGKQGHEPRARARSDSQHFVSPQHNF